MLTEIFVPISKRFDLFFSHRSLPRMIFASPSPELISWPRQIGDYLVQRSQDGHFVVFGFAEAPAVVEVDGERIVPEGLHPGIAYQVYQFTSFPFYADGNDLISEKTCSLMLYGLAIFDT